MPRVAERMTEKRLRSLTKGCSCGVVPGLEVRVRTLGDGSTAKYFLLRDRATGKAYQIGQYPKVSLSDAFKTAAEWREKIKAGIDPVAERKALRMSLQAEEPAPVISFMDEDRHSSEHLCKDRPEASIGSLFSSHRSFHLQDTKFRHQQHCVHVFTQCIRLACLSVFCILR